MSKKAGKPNPQPVQAQAQPTKQPFRISYPILWLVIAAIAVYFQSLQFGFTELDDSIFIKELASYVEDISNLATSFTRGVFHPTNDTYYRPMFLNMMILNYQFSGQEVAGYHLVNLLLHLGCVVLLFKLLRKLNLGVLQAFLLTLLFAIHPVLSQAVAWIPGRNDTLLALFLLPYLIYTIDYAEKGKMLSLVLATLFLVAGMFTKETALLAPAAAWIVLVIIMKRSWKEQRVLIQYGAWVLGAIIYLAVRSGATIKSSNLHGGQMAIDFVKRLPLLVQYLGKIIFPFNLSVFPILEDTVYYWGIAAIVILAVIIFLAKGKNTRIILGGFGLFFIFLLPVLLVPNALNEQTFEHRLYLPIIGILLVLSQTILFKNHLKPSSQAGIVAGICLVFAVINFNHQKYFADSHSFWKQAAETSPNSSYALMMYAARYDGPVPEKYAMVRKAYRINPNEKYLNYYYGLMMQEQDSIAEAEKHFLKEQQISDYYECDFYLAHIDFQQKNLPGAVAHLERYLTRDSLKPEANNNLLLLYMEMKQKDKALNQIATMRRRGTPVPAGVEQQVQGM